jgi:hypothetical protein
MFQICRRFSRSTGIQVFPDLLALFIASFHIAKVGGRAVRLGPVEEWRNGARSGGLRKK